MNFLMKLNSLKYKRFKQYGTDGIVQLFPFLINIVSKSLTTDCVVAGTIQPPYHLPGKEPFTVDELRQWMEPTKSMSSIYSDKTSSDSDSDFA